MGPRPDDTEAPAFGTTYRPGRAWVAGRRLREQPLWLWQIAWWRAMELEGRMVLVGQVVRKPEVPDDRDLMPLVLVNWRAATLREAQAWANAAPLVQTGVLAAETAPTAQRVR